MRVKKWWPIQHFFFFKGLVSVYCLSFLLTSISVIFCGQCLLFYVHNQNQILNFNVHVLIALFLLVVSGPGLFFAALWLPSRAISSRVWSGGGRGGVGASIVEGASGHGSALIPAGLLGALPCAAKCYSRVPQTAPWAKACRGTVPAQHQAGHYLHIPTCCINITVQTFRG